MLLNTTKEMKLTKTQKYFRERHYLRMILLALNLKMKSIELLFLLMLIVDTAESFIMKLKILMISV